MKEDRRFSVMVEVPAGTTAFVTLPDGLRATVRGGDHGTERTFVS
jgi:hypothetical protein